MKKILGLDLGVTSCGWALIQANDDYQPEKILGIGSRIIPLSPDDKDEFSKGRAISKNAARTAKRTQRKGYDRYQLRRLNLRRKLSELGMLPDDSLIGLDVLSLWSIRANAATKDKQISLSQLGRVLLHLNQKRGYKHSKSDVSADSKQTDYVKCVNERKAKIDSLGLTIGQYFTEQIKLSETLNENGKKFYTYRIKDQVFPRQAYENEFDTIMMCQQKFYPNVLTDETISELRNIIYWQRPLKSCKHLVALCDFEKCELTDSQGKKVICGPKVAPRTSPLFQVCRLWESINNIVIKNRRRLKDVDGKQMLSKDFSENFDNNTYFLSLEERKKIFDYLNVHEKLTGNELFKLIGLSKNDGWYFDKAIGKGIKGNDTYVKLAKALTDVLDYEKLLEFNFSYKDTNDVDLSTGEIIVEVDNDSMMAQPLFKLWHTIYSIKDKDELAIVLKRNFNISDDGVIHKLYNIDFVTPGFGNKSSKFMRKILPYLQEGMQYSEASLKIGVNHSNSISKEENEKRNLLEKLPQIQKNELRQPIVEKILNQMINLVNAVKEKYGEIDEIRVELARELKQSKDEREESTKRISKNEKENSNIRNIISEYVVPSRSRVQKYKMWKESSQCCMYCGQPVQLSDFLNGYGVEVEHIIPRSLFFDDSFSNKVCSCRECNKNKNNQTAYDFMKRRGKERGQEEFDKYLNRVNALYESKVISKTKRDRLLTSASNIPADFIDRDLRLSQYISRKAIEILKLICRNVYASSGQVTDFFRHIWGYDEILHSLNLDRYHNAELTELKEFEHKGQIHTEERIIGWSKRLDHRHHAIDALTIALTRQGYIQRLNNLNTERDAMFADLNSQGDEFKLKHSLLQEWASARPHFSVSEVKNSIAGIAVSFKAGKKVSTPGKRYSYVGGKKVIRQSGLIVPRGALSEESVYGRIKIIEKAKPIKYLFNNPHLVVNHQMREKIIKRLDEHNGDVKKAISSLKKKPIYWDRNSENQLQTADCFKDEFVLKYDLSALKYKDVSSIVDDKIRALVENRFMECDNNDGKFVKSLAENPICSDENEKMPIRSVRCFTGLNKDKVAPVKWNDAGEPIGYVKPGNNHHVALYLNPEGKVEECVVTFWNAVNRKKARLPIIVDNPAEVWDYINASNLEISEDVLSSLPLPDRKFLVSMQQNEMFLLGMSDEEFADAVSSANRSAICDHLYRVQKLSSHDYVFRYHLETTVDNDTAAKNAMKFHSVRSYNAFQALNPRKVKISLLGEILDGVTKERIV